MTWSHFVVISTICEPSVADTVVGHYGGHFSAVWCRKGRLCDTGRMKIDVTHTRAGFVLANTRPQAVEGLEGLVLLLTDELQPLWRATETELRQQGVEPPFWAFAWLGGQAVSRWVVENPQAVAGRTVLDFGCGCGMSGIVALRAGARVTVGVDIDEVACVAAALNSQLNEVALQVVREDLVGRCDLRWPAQGEEVESLLAPHREVRLPDVILAGDVFYDAQMAARVLPWLQSLANLGVLVVLGDPGRKYLQTAQMQLLAEYRLRTTTEIEREEYMVAAVWRLMPESGR
jgi:predicted nicotinamide N-methyase